MLVTIVLIHLFGFVVKAGATCSDVNMNVNCSFTDNQSCLQSYEKYDRHGLKWSQTTGSLRTYSQDRYNRRVATGTHLSDSPKGSFMYLDASTDERTARLWTDLVSPPVTIDDEGCLYFYYHNDVCETAEDPEDISFRVLIKLDSEYNQCTHSKGLLLKEFPCIDDSQWYRARIPINGISGIYRIVFSARQHFTPDTTIAVDHVIYSDQSCSSRQDSSFVEGDNDFEDAIVSGYVPSNDKIRPEGTLRWLPIQKKMRKPYKKRDQAPDGNYLTLFGNDNRTSISEHTAISVMSPEISLATNGCLSLRYYSGRHDLLENDNVTALHVSRVPTNSSYPQEFLYKFPSTLGDEWVTAFVELPEGTYQLNFSAMISLPFGESPNDIISMDDIEIHQSTCKYVRCQTSRCKRQSSAVCRNGGTCVGRGIKHMTCQCASTYFGKYCQYRF